MTDIKYIPIGCAVFNTETHLYHANLPYNYGSCYYQGETTLLAGINILSSLDNIHKIESKEVVVGYKIYKNSELLEELTLDEYNSRLAQEDTNSIEWLRLKYNKKETTLLQENKVQCIINNIGNFETPNSKYIVCKLDTFYAKGIYELDCRQLELDILEKTKQLYPSLTVDIPKHSHLRFMKINNKYVLDDKWSDRRMVKFRGTLEQCIEKEAQIVSEATTDFSVAFKNIITMLSEISLHDFKVQLDAIKKIAQTIKIRNTKEASQQKNTLISCVNDLHNLICSIENLHK